MQEEVNEKTIALIVTGGKISAEILEKSLAKLARRLEEQKRERKAVKREKRKNQKASYHPGRKTLRLMMKEGSQLSNIEITDKNIRSFEKVARKYSIQYSLKKDKASDPPKYIVFFRAKDVDVMTAAFKEYAGSSLSKSRKVSVRKRLHKAVERSANHRNRQRTRQKDRGQER